MDPDMVRQQEEAEELNRLRKSATAQQADAIAPGGTPDAAGPSSRETAPPMWTLPSSTGRRIAQALFGGGVMAALCYIGGGALDLASGERFAFSAGAGALAVILISISGTRKSARN